MQTLEGHSSSVWSVAFSRDCRQIALGSGDETIKVWDCESGVCTQTLEGHDDWAGSENNKHAFEPRYGYRYGLSMDQRWTYQHNQNILWLLPDYRPSSSAVLCCYSHISIMSDRCLFESAVALGCPSGRVIVLGLADDRSCHRQK